VRPRNPAPADFLVVQVLSQAMCQSVDLVRAAGLRRLEQAAAVVPPDLPQPICPVARRTSVRQRGALAVAFLTEMATYSRL
jgi:hypothetical protein